MKDIRTAAQEAAEDLFFGQLVMIAARWSLILAYTILVLWTATEETQLVLSILPVVALMAMNFYLHGRYLLERPGNKALTMAAGLVDLSVVTATLLIWPGQGGLASPFFVLYYPVLLAFGFVFSPRLSATYAVLALLGYIGACLIADISFLGDSRELEVLIQRLTTLAATGVLSTYYWRIQRERRRVLMGGPAAMQDLKAHG